jgi:2-polyprenyl-3-methyl-5-hydroxy-6-metoxy-1,4-benzoquinol methylase
MRPADRVPPRAGCPVCGEPRRERLFEKAGWPVARCLSCALVYVDADLDRAALEALYDRDYYEGDVFADYFGEREARIASGHHRVRSIARLNPTGRLLDVGCAAGFFLVAASERYEVTGVEVSAFAARYAREEFGLRVFTGELVDAPLQEGEFDVVTMWDVIEHLPDPRAALAQAARVMRPGGLLVLTTGDAEGRLARRNLEQWNLMTPPAHLTFFSPRTLEQLLNASGFEVLRRVADGIFSSRPRLASPLVHAVAGTLGIGNVMTVFARRTEPARRRPLRARVPRQLMPTIGRG